MERVDFWRNLREQVRVSGKAQYATNTKDKWHLLREEWDEHFCAEDHLIVLKQAGLPLSPRPLATYADGEKRMIALAVQDLLAFADRYKALCGRKRKLFKQLSKEFPK